MAYIEIALALVKLGNLIFRWIERTALEKAGENRQSLKSLQAMNAVSVVLKNVDERFAKMTNEEIKAEIAGHGDFRD